MKKTWHSLKNRVTAMLLALICVLGLLPTTALAAGADTIKLERFGMSGVSYQSASLGRCTMHQMYYGVAGKTSVGFCGAKGGGMGTSLIGQTWGDPKPVTDPTVKMMMAYYYAHSLGIFTDKAHALGVDDIWDSGYSWYMNAWVQAIVWRYKDGSLGDPATACAEELMYVWNSLKGTSYTSIDHIPGPGEIYPGSGQAGCLGRLRRKRVFLHRRWLCRPPRQHRPERYDWQPYRHE